MVSRQRYAMACRMIVADAEAKEALSKLRICRCGAQYRDLTGIGRCLDCASRGEGRREPVDTFTRMREAKVGERLTEGCAMLAAGYDRW